MPMCFSRKIGAGLLDQNQPVSSEAVGLMILDNQPDRMTLCRRRILQVSDLSTVDGE